MRKIIMSLAVSMDGFISGPNGEYDWCFSDQDYGFKKFLSSVDTLLIGRASYEMMQAMDADPSQPEQFVSHAKYVISTTLDAVDEGYQLINTSVVKHLRDLKLQPGKDIWLFGGAVLCHSLMDQGLVDRMWLAVHPIILGDGKRLFPKQSHRTTLQLVDSKVYDTGLISVTYDLLNTHANS